MQCKEQKTFPPNIREQGKGKQRRVKKLKSSFSISSFDERHKRFF